MERRPRYRRERRGAEGKSQEWSFPQNRPGRKSSVTSFSRMTARTKGKCARPKGGCYESHGNSASRERAQRACALQQKGDMSEAVIQVEKLGKRFHIGKLKAGTTLRDALTSAVKAPFERRAADEDTILWALRDVSFEVKQGEVVGLIGRNGAGKSTLLKLLARITRPTEGWAEIKGRTGSLLEVGTGFHPELSGRENVFLSGAILGMKKVEIQRKFDEIVAFSEVERFLDTPLKHYSSGMQVRLAFAVAAHLEPEILLVDEVLAVGDASFQKKCLGKMKDVAYHGRTVIFVSHSMAAIDSLCSRGLMLERGSISYEGRTADVTAHYYRSVLEPSEGDDLSKAARTGNGKARFVSISIRPLAQDQELQFAYPGCDLRVEVELECRKDFEESVLAAIIYDANGYRVVDTNTGQKGAYVRLQAGQRAATTFFLKELLLKPGRYFVGLWLGRHGMEEIDHVERAVSFDVIGNEETSRHVVIYPGVYLCRFEHRTQVVECTEVGAR